MSRTAYAGLRRKARKLAERHHRASLGRDPHECRQAWEIIQADLSARLVALDQGEPPPPRVAGLAAAQATLDAHLESMGIDPSVEEERCRRYVVDRLELIGQRLADDAADWHESKA